MYFIASNEPHESDPRSQRKKGGNCVDRDNERGKKKRFTFQVVPHFIRRPRDHRHPPQKNGVNPYGIKSQEKKTVISGNGKHHL